MTRTTGTASAILLALALGSAAEVRPAHARAADVDVCSLLTSEEAAAALGATPEAPKNIPQHDMGGGALSSACEYAGGSRRMTLNVIRMPAQMAAIYKSMCGKKSRDGLSALGDMSCWYNDNHEELQVIKGVTFFSIELRGVGKPTEPIKAAARHVLNRL